MQAQTRMYIGLRNPQLRHDGTDEFQSIVSIEMGVIEEGQTSQLLGSSLGQPVRLYDRNAKVFKTNQNGRPLIALDATLVQAAIEADLQNPNPLTAIIYHLALANLNILEDKLSGPIEVVFESYLPLRIAR
jgi:hypothetical protein